LRIGFSLTLCLFGWLTVGEVIVPVVMGQEMDQAPREACRALRPGKPKRPPGDPIERAIPPDVAPLERLSLVLGRPTAHSVMVSLLSAEGLEKDIFLRERF
jgi:hypothetical protein